MVREGVSLEWAGNIAGTIRSLLNAEEVLLSEDVVFCQEGTFLSAILVAGSKA